VPKTVLRNIGSKKSKRKRGSGGGAPSLPLIETEGPLPRPECDDGPRSCPTCSTVFIPRDLLPNSPWGVSCDSCVNDLKATVTTNQSKRPRRRAASAATVKNKVMARSESEHATDLPSDSIDVDGMRRNFINIS
jgi:hypothetical protein